MATDAELAALYQKRIRDLAGRIRVDRRLSDPQVTVTRRSLVCGSMVTLDIDFEGGRVERIGFRTRACSLGTASTAIVVDAGPGQNQLQFQQAAQALRSLLAEDGQPLSPACLEALEVFSASFPFPGRHDSIMLPFAAVEEAFGQQAGGSG